LIEKNPLAVGKTFNSTYHPSVEYSQLGYTVY